MPQQTPSPSVTSKGVKASGSSGVPSTPKGQGAGGATQPKPKKQNPMDQVMGFFKDPAIQMDRLPDDEAEIAQHQKMVSVLIWNSYAIIGLIFLFIILFPILRPTYTYYALQEQVLANPQDLLKDGYALSEEGLNSLKAKQEPLFPLDSPNITTQALLSWVATASTEILTLGFGEFDKLIRSHRRWFTSQGWESYIEAMNQSGLRQDFLSRQLVLTTVPSDMPMIAGQGLNKEKKYVWYVSMPVIMNFATNNNVKSTKNSEVHLEIIRVDTKENPAGIAINSWKSY